MSVIHEASEQVEEFYNSEDPTTTILARAFHQTATLKGTPSLGFSCSLCRIGNLEVGLGAQPVEIAQWGDDGKQACNMDNQDKSSHSGKTLDSKDVAKSVKIGIAKTSCHAISGGDTAICLGIGEHTESELYVFSA